MRHTTDKIAYIAFLILAAGNIFIWQQIIFAGPNKNLEFYFLNVGQGDSQLVNLPNDVQILIDGGPGPKVLSELTKALRPADRYIDLVIASHPELDHYGGLIEVLKTYKVGAVITNGRHGTAAAYQDFARVIKENGVPEIHLAESDNIKYEDTIISVLSPNAKNLKSKKTNDSGLVLMFKNGGLRALFAADIGFDVERELVKKYDLSAQILKVPHHGSKYSSSKEFLNKVQPKISIIGVGKNNYGHPTNEVLSKLANIGSQVFRTDKNRTLKIIFDRDVLKIYN